MNKVSAVNNINVLPRSARLRYLPYIVVKILTGGRIISNYENKEDIVGVEWNGKVDVFHVDDFSIAKEVADDIWTEIVVNDGQMANLMTIPLAMKMHNSAIDRIDKKIGNSNTGKRGVIMLQDTTGCGYWRMIVPARYIDRDKFFVDIAQVGVVYDHLLEYDTIFVQRLHTWDQYYVVEKLKKAGKYIVYDIDDDIFNVPASNPASQILTQDYLEAAKCIMGLVDKIVTPSEVIKERLGFQDKTVVIPNALDVDDFVKLSGNDATDLKNIGSPDGNIRILWQGSATHSEDWLECAEAVDNIMRNNSNVIVQILGYLPPVISAFVNDENRPWWDGRVEYMEFTDIETYLEVTKKLRADIAIAPLEDTKFNQAKSPLKFEEYSAIGVPVVASNVAPYKEVIRHKENGFLAKGVDEWEACMEMLIADPKERLRLVRGARETVSEQFDIKNVINDWEEIFSGD